jgi:hypothetical protein
VTTGQAYLPDVPFTYVGNGPNAGLSIVAGTISQSGTAPTEILIALKSVGPDPVCIVIISADLMDASDTVLKHVDVIVNSPMYKSFGDATQCLGAGDMGYGHATVGFDSFDISKVAKVEYGISGNIDPDATKLTDVTAEVTGSLTNHSSTQMYKYPEIQIYTLDAAGRPLAHGEDIDAGNLATSGTWQFMLYISSPVDKYVALPNFKTP